MTDQLFTTRSRSVDFRTYYEYIPKDYESFDYYGRSLDALPDNDLEWFETFTYKSRYLSFAQRLSDDYGFNMRLNYLLYRCTDPYDFEYHGTDGDKLYRVKAHSKSLKELIEGTQSDLSDCLKYVEQIDTDATKSKDNIDQKLAEHSKTLYETVSKYVKDMAIISQLLENDIDDVEQGKSESLNSKFESYVKDINKLSTETTILMSCIKFSSENTLNTLRTGHLECIKDEVDYSHNILKSHISSFDSYFATEMEDLRLKKVLDNSPKRIEQSEIDFNSFIKERETLMIEVETLKQLIDNATVDIKLYELDDYVKRISDYSNNIMRKQYLIAESLVSSA